MQVEAVAELPPNKQGQVDMGEISVETQSGRFRKLHCHGMVLFHSRQKFVLCRNTPLQQTALLWPM